MISVVIILERIQIARRRNVPLKVSVLLDNPIARTTSDHIPEGMGFDILPATPDQATDFMSSKLVRWSRVAAHAGIKAE
jgi:hypothetical protein